jgi:MFS family permease
MLPLGLWSNRIVRISNLSGFGIGAVMMAGSAFLPAYIQAVLGYSPTIAGTALTIMSLSWSFGSITGGRIMVRSSFWLTGSLGGVFLLAGSIMMAAMTMTTGLPWVIVACFLFGTGLGSTNTTFLIAIQSTVNWELRGIATSSNLFARMMGRSLGAALFGAILNFGINREMPGQGDVFNHLLDPAFHDQFSPEQKERLTGVIAGSLHNLYMVAALLALITLVVLVRLPRGVRPSTKFH